MYLCMCANLSLVETGFDAQSWLEIDFCSSERRNKVAHVLAV